MYKSSRYYVSSLSGEDGFMIIDDDFTIMVKASYRANAIVECYKNNKLTANFMRYYFDVFKEDKSLARVNYLIDGIGKDFPGQYEEQKQEIRDNYHKYLILV
jgi:hypothetical protein